MNLETYFKQMATSDALIDYANKRFEDKLSRFRGEPIKIHITFSVNNLLHTVLAEVIAPDGFKIVASDETENMYQAIDNVAQKLSRQLLKHKNKLQSHRATEPSVQKLIQHQVEAPIDARDVLDYEKKHIRPAVNLRA
jgi:putative sigma-54 modulation protein